MVIGTPFRGRTEPEEQNAIGYLIDVIPLNLSRWHDEDSVRIFISQVSQLMAQCITNARVPPESRCSAKGSFDSLYRAFFSFYDHPRVRPQLHLPADLVHLVTARDGIEGTTKFDISIDLVS